MLARERGEESVLRTEQDLSLRTVGIGAVAVFLVLAIRGWLEWRRSMRAIAA